MSDLEKVLEGLERGPVFLTGGAGVGKSHTTNEVIRHYRKQGRQVVALGSTGVSAVNIGGFTIHSFFVFGISSNFEELKQSDRRAKKRLADLKKILQATDLIVIDEISMVSTEMLDMIAYRLETAGYTGKLLFVGDFFQLPPIRRGSSAHLFGEQLYAFESSAWQTIAPEVIELREMKRTRDSEFTRILHKIRVGDCDEEVVGYLEKIWNNESAYANEPTYLFGRNQEVEITNRSRIDALDTEETILFANLEMFGSV